jgi:anti-anti-sigma regulatory factor
MIIRSMVDHVDVERSETGTRVTVRHAVRRRVSIGSSQDGPAVVAAGTRVDEDFRTVLHRSEHPVLAVRGPVDQSSADRLRVEILSASRGGALPLTVDLTGVTHLASVGVRLLHQLVRSDSTGLRMRAAMGTPADQILTLTGLEHIDKR